MNKKKLYLFGASKRGEFIYNLLKNHNEYKIMAFLDNSRVKWGATFCSIEVVDPNSIKDNVSESDLIIITSMYSNEIENQLIRLGFKHKVNFISDTDFISELVVLSNLDLENIQQNEETLVLTLPNGNILGGLEKWTKDVYKEAKNVYPNTKVYSFVENISCYNYKQMDEEIFSKKYTQYLSSIKRICLELMSYRKVTVILNNTIEIIIALKVLEKYNISTSINIISVLHILNQDVLNFNIKNEKVINHFLCVSEEIGSKLKKCIPHRNGNIHVKISPISNSYILTGKRNYTTANQPIILGYASRLESIQKRSEDIFKLIEYLEEFKVDYFIRVVGSGSLEKKFENITSSKLIYYGEVEHEKIKSFWLENDIFLNFSDTEGTSLSMLEAMSQGVIPVVTNVSGVKKFVNYTNGKIVNVGDLKSMAEYILFLSNNKKQLKILGENSIEKVRKYCNKNEYFSFLFGLN